MKGKLTIFVILAVLVPAMVFGQGFGRGRMMMQAKGPVFEKLKLTDDQMDKIKEIRKSNQKEMIDLQASIKKIKIDIAEMMDADNINEKAILAKTQEISDIQAKIAQIRTLHHIQISKVLTKEQRDQMKKMRGAGRMLRGKRGMRGGMRDGMRGGMRDGMGGEFGPGMRGNRGAGFGMRMGVGPAGNFDCIRGW